MRVFLFFKSKKFLNIIKDTLLILLGCIISAIGTASLLLPNQLSTGGFSGIATIIYYFFNINMATSIVFLNIPLFIIGFIKLGNKFVFKTIFATILYSALIDVFENYTLHVTIICYNLLVYKKV